MEGLFSSLICRDFPRKMFWPTVLAVVLLGSNLFQASVEAFSPNVWNRSPQATNSILFLLPSQGAQLAAAGSCAYDQDKQKHTLSNKTADQQYHDNTVPLTHKGEDTSTEISFAASSHHSHSVARSFVSRVFSLPATLLHPRENNDSDDEQCSLYPVVGFQLVHDDDTHFCRAFPTTSNPSCRLMPTNQELVGYYSPACHLNCDGDDDIQYSQRPE